MLHNIQAIVLNNHNYGNSSLICNLFSNTQGKVSIIAKGAKTIKNPNSALLQPLNCVDVIYYHKETRNIQLLKEASLNIKFKNIRDSYKKMVYSLTLIDIINKISFHGGPCEIIFRLTKTTLIKIDEQSDDLIALYYIFFQIQLLIYLGYQPSFFSCYNCHEKIVQGCFNQEAGMVICNKCRVNQKIIIDSDDLAVIEQLMSTHINDIHHISIKHSEVLNKINFLLYRFILFHLPEVKYCKLFKERNIDGLF